VDEVCSSSIFLATVRVKRSSSTATVEEFDNWQTLLDKFPLDGPSKNLTKAKIQ